MAFTGRMPVRLSAAVQKMGGQGLGIWLDGAERIGDERTLRVGTEKIKMENTGGKSYRLEI